VQSLTSMGDDVLAVAGYRGLRLFGLWFSNGYEVCSFFVSDGDCLNWYDLLLMLKYSIFDV
jgi:hypothetical protein